MEYTFRNTAREQITTVALTNYNLIVRTGGKEESISYPTITMVRLYKAEDLYKIVLYPDGKLPITISNKFYTDSGKQQDQSRAYNTWVRVLHFHLKDKSKASYISGLNIFNLLLWMLIAVFLCFVASFVSDYFNLLKINGWLQGAILSLFVVVVVFVANSGKLPKDYKPENIPLQFLP